MTVRGILVAATAVVSSGPVLSAQHSYPRSEIENGARLFQGSCATCHGPRGDAVRGVVLLSGRFQRVHR
jgi:mono/diheme cytochrome c family protein